MGVGEETPDLEAQHLYPWGKLPTGHPGALRITASTWRTPFFPQSTQAKGSGSMADNRAFPLTFSNHPAQEVNVTLLY